MKRIALSLLIVVTLFAFGCGNQDTPAHSDAGTDQSENSMIENAQPGYNTALYRTSEGGEIFSSECTTAFDTVEFIDESAKQTLKVEILNTEYTTEYQNSAKLPLADMTVHVYKLKDFGNSRIMIDADTGRIMKYVGVPHEEVLESEAEHIEFIEKIVGSTYDLSEYDYECKTHYYSFSDGGMSSQVVDGYRICGENEEIGNYLFYYTQSIGEIKTMAHISAEIRDDAFYLEIYDLQYDTQMLDRLIGKLSDMDNKVEQFLISDLKDDYTLNEVSVKQRRLFTQNGIPYFITIADVSFKTNENTEPFTTVVQTVTYWNGPVE